LVAGRHPGAEPSITESKANVLEREPHAETSTVDERKLASRGRATSPELVFPAVRTSEVFAALVLSWWSASGQKGSAAGKAEQSSKG
jgi:hypothetical protein